MGKIWKKLKQEPNLALTVVIFFAIGLATIAYLYVVKPSTNIYTVINSLLIFGIVSLFFFLRSVLTPRRSEAQETAANHEECLG